MMKIDFKTLAWVENETISFSQVSEGFLKQYIQEWRIKPEDSGCTFSFREEIGMPYGFLGKLVERVGKGSSEATVKNMLAKLKELVESE